MIKLWQRAARNELLSPEERALLKFVKFTLASALISATVAVYPSMAGAEVDWTLVFHTFIATFGLSLVVTIDKYVTAHLNPSTTLTTPVEP